MVFATIHLVRHMRKIKMKKAMLVSKAEQDKGINKSVVVIVTVCFITSLSPA